MVPAFPPRPQEISSLTTIAFSGRAARREGEVFTLSNIYLLIRYQVHKCKYPESIIKSIRNYRESNKSCNKVTMLTHATMQMNPEDIIPSEISQSEKDKYCMIPLMCDTYGSQTHRGRH